MLSISIRSRPTMALRNPAYAVGFAFLTLSVIFGSWLARLPEVQSRLMLSDGSLGMALLGASAGSLAGMPLANRTIRSLSTGASTTLFSLLFCMSMVLPAFASSGLLLFAALFMVGACNGAMNISMNAAASSLERHRGMNILSACHGMYSLGIVIGAGTAGMIAEAGVPLPLHLAGLGLLFALGHLFYYSTMSSIPRDVEAGRQKLAWPPKVILGLALVGFCVWVGEGAVADWSAVYLSRDLGSSIMVAGWGYAAFSVTMAIGRFIGDRIRARYAASRLVILGGLVGGTGLILAILSNSPGMALTGFALSGAGYALLVPVLYSEAARLYPESPSTGISAVATAGITGFLMGPPIIGWLAGIFGLGAGLGFAAALTFLGVFLTWAGFTGGSKN